MSRLLNLVERLRSIPAKEEHADKVGALLRLCEVVERGAEDFSFHARAARHAVDVTGREDFGVVGAAAARVTRPAQRLRKAMVNDPEQAASRRGDELMILIRDQEAAARKALRDRWRAFVDATKRDYGALARAGRDARLPGAPGLEEALRDFEAAAGSPPDSDNAARRVRYRRETLRAAVRDLGLEGDVGVFMVAAAEGRANPRDLYKPAVKDFLDARPEVWRLLSVTL